MRSILSLLFLCCSPLCLAQTESEYVESKICVAQTRLTPGTYVGNFFCTFYAGTDSAITISNSVTFTFVDTGSYNGYTLFPDSGWYHCYGGGLNPPSGGGIYHVTSDSIILSDRVAHTADFDWTLILNGAFSIQFRTDSLIMKQNDTKFLRYRYINLALQTTGVTKYTSSIARKWDIFQNFPNPFNPTTTITFEIGSKSEVTLVVFDLLGQQVATLLHGRFTAGVHSVLWNASAYSSGIYLCRIVAGDFTKTTKLALTK